MKNSATYRTLGVVCAIGGVLAFSVKAVVAKLMYRHGIDAVTLMAMRMSIALPVFLGIGLWIARHTAAPPIARREWGTMIAIGLTGYYAASFLDFIGLQYVTAGIGRLILFAYPTITVALSALFLKRRVTRAEVMALLITYAGVALVLSNAVGGQQSNLPLGATLITGAAFFTAAFLVWSAESIRRVGSMRFTSYAMSLAALPSILQFPLLRPWSALDLPLEAWGLAAVLSLVCTVLPLFLTAEALRRVGANQVALFGALGPVMTILISNAVLGESMQALQWAGALLVMAGVALVTMRPSR